MDAYAIDNDRDTKKLAWHFRNYLSLEELLPEHTRFEASEAEGMFPESAQIFLVGKPKATNQVAWKDLLHFAIVTICIFVCYSNAGVFLFASAHDDFQKFDYAVITCMNMLFGSFDWQMWRSTSSIESK